MCIDMILMCATDWWIFGATLFSGLATAGVALYIGCQQKKLQQRQLDLELKNNLKELNAALYEVEGRTKMFDSVALCALESSVPKVNDAYKKQALYFYEPYGQFYFDIIQKLAQSEEYAEIYLSEEIKKRMNEVYELLNSMRDLYESINQTMTSPSEKLQENILSYLHEHRVSETHLNPEKASAQFEKIVSADETLKTKFCDFKNKRNLLFGTNHIRRQLNQLSHNKK